MENQNLNNTITDDDIKSLLVGIFAFQKRFTFGDCRNTKSTTRDRN